jgi:hypothetical protein
MVRALLIATAIVETATGAALLLVPALVVSLLLGATLDGSAVSILARVLGAALVALGLVSWLARDDARSPAARGLVVGLLFYNTAVLTLLSFAGFGPELRGVALWPAVAPHATLGAWCGRCLLTGRGDEALR